MHKSILYIGNLEDACNSFRRFSTLKKMGYDVDAIDNRKFLYDSFFVSFHHHLNVGPGIIALNRAVLKKIERHVPDLIWVDNKPYLQPGVLKKIRSKFPSIKIINLITDDPLGRYSYAWRLFARTIGYYDIHFVQRKINVQELKDAGANRVEICYRSYDRGFHRPLMLTEEEKQKYGAGVGFIGSYEVYREEYIVYLLKNNIRVTIRGNGWEKAKHWKFLKPFFQGTAVYKDEYIKSLNGFDIALHFLRRVNRDEQDSRTFEIPACGAFMLAEKSDVHLSLFEDGKEAVFFGTKDELLKQVKYYLEHADERNAIARAGHERCITSGYSHEARLGEVLSKIMA